MTHERPNIKTIRIKKSVCERLDERKGRDESYSEVIKALLDENDRLKESNVELKQDKDLLMRLFLLNVPNINDYKISDSKEQQTRLKKEISQINDILKDW